MDYKSLPEKNVLHSNKGLFYIKYLFALCNESEQILTLSIKPKVHTSYILNFFFAML